MIEKKVTLINDIVPQCKYTLKTVFYRIPLILCIKRVLFNRVEKSDIKCFVLLVSTQEYWVNVQGRHFDFC